MSLLKVGENEQVNSGGTGNGGEEDKVDEQPEEGRPRQSESQALVTPWPPRSLPETILAPDEPASSLSDLCLVFDKSFASSIQLQQHTQDRCDT